MTSNRIVTAFITTYKRPHLVGRAIQSVLNQTYPHFQIIVCDDASQDGTEEAVAQYVNRDKRVHYHCHSQNIGLMGNYEFIFSKISTPYFFVLSDDDVLFPWFIERTLKGLKDHPNAAFSAGGAVVMTEQGEIMKIPNAPWKREGYYSCPEGLFELIGKYPITGGILFNFETIKSLPFTLDRDNPLAWDADLLIQLASHFPFVISKEPCLAYLYHLDSYSVTKDTNCYRISISKLIQRVQKLDLIKHELKADAIKSLDQSLKDMTYGTLLNFIYLKNPGEVYRSAKIYHESYGPSLKTYLLLAVAKILTKIPLSIFLLLFIRKLRRSLKKENIQRNYGLYSKWLHPDKSLQS